jgi:phage gp46-like protein
MDIALQWSNETWQADLVLTGGQLLVDNTLQTSVIISLFTDRRAEPDDVLPDEDPNHPGGGDPRGWWGDWYMGQMLAQQQAVPGTANPPAFRLGSRFWLLSRSKETQDALSKAQQYGQECLQWLLDYGIASSVTVTSSILREGWLGVTAEIARGRTVETYKYEFAWGAAA